MKALSITFHANANGLDNHDYQHMLNRLITTKGSKQQFPKFGFESRDVWWPYSEREYGVQSVFEQLSDSDFAFRGVKVVFDPSECMFGHTLLPNNDMDTARRLAFRLLNHVLEAHFSDDDHPFIKLFDQYDATVDGATTAFYVPFDSHEAARKSLHAVVSTLDQNYSDQEGTDAVLHGQPTCEGTLNDTIWAAYGPKGMGLRMYVIQDPNFDRYASWTPKYATNMSIVSDALLESARTVLVIEADLRCDWLADHNLVNPLIWDLPSVDVYGFICRELKKVLGAAANELTISTKPPFTPSIVEATFNRQTGMAYFQR